MLVSVSGMPPRVVIGIPLYDSVSQETFSSLLRLQGHEAARALQTSLLDVLTARGSLIHRNRNHIVASAIATKMTHLLFIDSDMKFPANALETLLADAMPVIGGLCWMRAHPYAPVALQARKSDGHYETFRPPGDDIVTVDATGCGFLLIERRVLEAIPADRWFARVDDRDIGEDMAFCERAGEAGFQIAVDTRVDIGHVGRVVVDRAFAEPLCPPLRSKEEIHVGDSSRR